MRTVMAFGAFDGFHEGHRHFLREAKTHGERLIVVVAPDSIVEVLKGKKPKEDEGKRMKAVLDSGEVQGVILGDEATGSWKVIIEHKPDVIALGYDQEGMRKDLERAQKEFVWNPEICMMQPYQPEVYKSSFLN